MGTTTTTTTQPINILPSWGTNKVAINYKLGWASPDFYEYLKEWLRIPHNIELVVCDEDFTRIPARVMTLALMHRKCYVLSAKNDAEILRYDDTIKSVAKGNAGAKPEIVRLKDFVDDAVRIIYQLVLEAAQDIVEASRPPSLPTQGPKAWITLVSPHGHELKGLFHACATELHESMEKYCSVKECEPLPQQKETPLLHAFIEYATDVKTLEFVAKGLPRMNAHLAIMEILSKDPGAEQRLRKTHRELAKRHDIAVVYQEASVARAHVRSALSQDPHKKYKQQVIS